VNIYEGDITSWENIKFLGEKEWSLGKERHTKGGSPSDWGKNVKKKRSRTMKYQPGRGLKRGYHQELKETLEK